MSAGKPAPNHQQLFKTGTAVALAAKSQHTGRVATYKAAALKGSGAAVAAWCCTQQHLAALQAQPV
jgi:hypothetical protein